MAFSLSPAARVFTCGEAVLQSQMGVFRTPSNFSPELTERQRGQLLPSPQKVTLRLRCSLVNAVAASFAPAKLGRASRATRDLTRRLRLATNLFRKRARTLFLSGLQSLYKIPAGEAQRDFPALSGHRLKSRSVPQRRDFPVSQGHLPRLFCPSVFPAQPKTGGHWKVSADFYFFSFHYAAAQIKVKKRKENSCGGSTLPRWASPHQPSPLTAPSRRPGARCRPPRG